jgi:hypothetical protein
VPTAVRLCANSLFPGANNNASTKSERMKQGGGCPDPDPRLGLRGTASRLSTGKLFCKANSKFAAKNLFLTRTDRMMVMRLSEHRYSRRFPIEITIVSEAVQM